MKPRITIEFESMQELQCWAQTQNAHEALQDFASYLRGQRKHVEEEDRDDVVKIEQKLFEICEEHDVDF